MPNPAPEDVYRPSPGARCIRAVDGLAATVVEYDDTADSFLLQYDEGGGGWWPAGSIVEEV